MSSHFASHNEDQEVSKNKPTHIEEVLGGEGQIYRMERSGDVYQCRIWIKQERKYLRRSLKTSNLDEARQRARDFVLEKITDVKQGKKVFGITFHDFCDQYLEYRRNDVGVKEGITTQRLRTIASQIAAYKKITSPKLKVGDIDENYFFDYASRRRKILPNVQPPTLKAERSTLGSIHQYAFRQKLTNVPKLIFKPLSITKGEVGKRDTFSFQEYEKLTLFLRSYVAKKNCPDAKKRKERLKIRDFIYILSNTLLRTGELRKMQWKDVQGFEETTDQNGKKITLVKLVVRPETSKVRSGRTIIVRGGNYFRRLRRYSNHTEPEDFIFTNEKNNKPVSSNPLYKHWDIIMRGIGVPDYKERKLSFYSLRHLGITWRMDAGVPIADVAVIAGTSSHQIEYFYRKPNAEMMTRAALRSFNRVRESGFENHPST